MAQDDSGGILMKLVTQNGVVIEGETTTILDTPDVPRDMLLRDFDVKHMFEVDNFTFSVNVDDDSGQEDGQKKKAPKALIKGTKTKPPAPQSYQAFRSHIAHKYPVAVQPIQFKRLVDRTSALLLQHCIDCTSFRSATLVKRKPTGAKAAGEAYLRLDFHGVLLTEVSWSNDEPVSATCKFISRKVRIQYRPQLPDGTLGAVVPGHWNSNPNESAIGQ